MTPMAILRPVLSRLRGYFGVSFGTGPSPDNYEFSEAWKRGLPVSTPGRLTNPYAEHPSVARAIGSIGEDAASVQWEVFRKTRPGSAEDEAPIEDHPLLALWQRPNASMSGSELWIATYTCFKLYGEAFWYYPGLSLGTRSGLAATRAPTGELILLHPDAVDVQNTKQRGVVYRMKGAMGGAPLDPNAITQFKRFNPYNPLRGLSELDALALELSGDRNAAAWNETFFGDQAGIPAGIAKPPLNQPLDKDKQDEFLKRWTERHSARKSFGILPPGWDYIDVGSAPKDMDFRSLREYAREQTFGVLGLPPFLAGVLDKANYANAREQKDVYWHNTITRLLTYFQSKLNADFLPKVGLSDVEVYPRWETVKALTDNLQEKATVAATLFALGFTKRMLNERLELGFDVDELDDPDVGYLPFAMAPVDSLGEARTAVGPIGSTPSATPSAEVQPASVQDGAARSAPDAREARRELVWRAVISNTRDLEGRFQRVIRSHYSSIEREVLEQFAGLKGWLLAHKLKGSDSDMFDKPGAKRRLMKQTEPIYRFSIQRGAEAIIAELDLESIFDPADVRVLAKVLELTGKITRIDDTVETRLREALSEGIGAGENAQQLAKRIEAVFSAGRARALMIARTETGQAFSWGRYAEMSDAGIDRHEWISARDAKVRDDHVAEDGNVVMLGETFPATGLAYPLDSSGPPEQIINCRCVAVPVVDSA